MVQTWVCQPSEDSKEPKHEGDPSPTLPPQAHVCTCAYLSHTGPPSHFIANQPKVQRGEGPVQGHSQPRFPASHLSLPLHRATATKVMSRESGLGQVLGTGRHRPAQRPPCLGLRVQVQAQESLCLGPQQMARGHILPGLSALSWLEDVDDLWAWPLGASALSRKQIC